MAAITNNIITSNDLFSLLILAVKDTCCNIDVEPDDYHFTSHDIKIFNITKTKNKNAAGFTKHKGGSSKDHDKTKYYGGNYTVKCNAYIKLNGIITPSITSLTNVETATTIFFTNTIKPIINNIINIYLPYYISLCVQRFINDTIICCISPYYNDVKFYFNYDITNLYTYSIESIISHVHSDDEILLFFNTDNLSMLNLTFTTTNNCRICTYTTRIEEEL